MWKDYFKLVGIVPGPVVVPKYGKIDFSDPGLSPEICKHLFENDFQYLKITEKGLNHFYGKFTPGKTRKTKTRKKQSISKKF